MADLGAVPPLRLGLLVRVALLPVAMLRKLFMLRMPLLRVAYPGAESTQLRLALRYRVRRLSRRPVTKESCFRTPKTATITQSVIESLVVLRTEGYPDDTQECGSGVPFFGLCLTFLKTPKSAVTMNHSQQPEPSFGKRTELICTPNKSNIAIRVKGSLLSFTLHQNGILKNCECASHGGDPGGPSSPPSLVSANGVTFTGVSVEHFDAFAKEIFARTTNDSREQMDVTMDRVAKRANENSVLEHEHEYAKRRNGPGLSPDKAASVSISIST
ncbi:hypothetical protein G5I_03707 [Acromyrmex echinatior]|uniref:Uncharacterized protein n=1 Tax=Acromyrmex echinatior TaxID=103372 RepID=F4WDP9_ACREC|nr:hypothetical protein G5I_03707 [Acromyrmex echinatior]